MSPATVGIGPTGPSFHLLAKPTGAVCNLDCAYCFFLSKEMLYPGSRFRMADELLEEYLRQLIEAHAGAPEVAIAWQGGEPTLMGIEFFRHVVEVAHGTATGAARRRSASRPTACCWTRSGRRSSSSTSSSSGSRSTAPGSPRHLPREQGRPGHVRQGHARPGDLRASGSGVQRADHRPCGRTSAAAGRCTASCGTSAGPGTCSSSRSSSASPATTSARRSGARGATGPVRQEGRR